MKGLVIKDLYLIKGYCKYLFLVEAAFLAASFFGDNASFFLAYIAVMAGTVPMALLSYDEAEKWNNYAEGLPVTRAQMVSGKYIIAAVVCFAASILITVVTAIQQTMTESLDILNIVTVFSIMLSIGLMSSSIVLPFVYKFGVNKGRIVYFIVIGGGMGISVGTSEILFGATANIAKYVNFLTILLAAAAIFGLSYWLSVKFYEKREL